MGCRIHKFIPVLILFLLLIASAVQGQSLYLVPHFNLNYPFSRIVDNQQGYSSFRARNLNHFGGNFGLFLEYQSTQRWRISSGISIGNVGLGYNLSYRNPGAYISREDVGMAVSNSFHRIPVLFMYNWKDVRLFQLRNFRKVNKRQSPKIVDESIFYALLFKVQPIVGASINYISKLHRWDYPGDTLNDYSNSHYFEIYRPIDQLRTVNASLIFGVRLQLYSFGKDRLALTVLYHQGLQDVLELNARYTIDGSDPYFSTIRTRGSGLSFTLSYPIRVLTFDKEERQLRKQNK